MVRHYKSYFTTLSRTPKSIGSRGATIWRNYTKSQYATCRRELTARHLATTAMLLRLSEMITLMRCVFNYHCRTTDASLSNCSTLRLRQALNRIRALWSAWALRTYRQSYKKSKANVSSVALIARQVTEMLTFLNKKIHRRRT